MNFTGSKHANRPRIQFTITGKSVPTQVSIGGKKYDVVRGRSRKDKRGGDPSNIAYVSGDFSRAFHPSQRMAFHITPTGRLVFDSKRAVGRRAKRLARRAAAKREKKLFNDSVENLQRIANSTATGRGGSHKFSGKRQPMTFRERALQSRARTYMEKRGYLVIQWDYNGNPDQLYIRSDNTVLGAVEFKDRGKKPTREQAHKILGLLNRMPVAVISDFEQFKAWLRRVEA